MRILRLIVNWAIVLSTPIWILPFIVVCIALYGFYDKNMFTGERWFWE